ncbi:MAG TPA: TetR/AcrR family transcriptional regulator [Woeseiaceae bacterium]|nr:TetR/AcrR family transcriptional regulator [Woeseiaceae bacterium]
MKRKSHPTRERILDAAEELFARDGFAAVTVRQIMRKADADVSLAYYHFKSKRDLFDSVMLRRVNEVNAIRLEALEKVEQRHSDDLPTVEEIIDAFTHPILDLLATKHEEWHHYFALIAQINSSSEWGGELMTRYFDPLVRRFIDALRHALPDCDDADLYWSYHFFSGALTMTMAETGRIDNLSSGACKSSDMAAINARMPQFIGAGFKAICGRDRSVPQAVPQAKPASARKSAAPGRHRKTKTRPPAARSK